MRRSIEGNKREALIESKSGAINYERRKRDRLFTHRATLGSALEVYGEGVIFSYSRWIGAVIPSITGEDYIVTGCLYGTGYPLCAYLAEVDVLAVSIAGSSAGVVSILSKIIGYSGIVVNGFGIAYSYGRPLSTFGKGCGSLGRSSMSIPNLYNDGPAANFASEYAETALAIAS